MSLSIPYTFTGGPGHKARASEVNSNFLAVASKFSEGISGISDGDISASANIRGTKLNNLPGSRVPTDRIEDGAITEAKLSSVPPAVTSAKIGTGAVLTAGIGDRQVTEPKLALGAALANLTNISIPLIKLFATVHQQAFGPLVAGNGTFPAPTTITPSVAFPKATWELIGVYVKTLNSSLAVAVITADDSGVNWLGKLSIYGVGASPSVSGTVSFVFIVRA